MLSITSNAKNFSHADHLSALVAGADEVLLVSPYLFDDFKPWVDATDLSSAKRLTLVTTLDPRGDNQLRKPAALMSLIQAMRSRFPTTRVRIQIDQLLHGKIYIARVAGRTVRGILTSANLTHSGMYAKHEWGVVSDDVTLLDEVRSQVANAVQFTDVSEAALREMLQCVDSYERRNPPIERPDVNVGLENILLRTPSKLSRSQKLDAGRGSRRIFLKPWGTAKDPLRREDHDEFSELEEELRFPRNPSPKDVRPGDMLINFATGTRCVLSVYRVLREPIESTASQQALDPVAARWPWYVAGQNVTPRLGRLWWKADLTIDFLQSQFGEAHSDAPLTEAGGSSLGALNFGAGRLRLSEQFGEYALERLLDLDETIT